MLGRDGCCLRSAASWSGAAAAAGRRPLAHRSILLDGIESGAARGPDGAVAGRVRFAR